MSKVIEKSERHRQRLVRQVAHYLDQDEPIQLDRLVRPALEPELMVEMREQKLLTRGSVATRTATAAKLQEFAQVVLQPKEASEYELYVLFGLATSEVRARLKGEFVAIRRSLPKLSLRQLIIVAERTFGKKMRHALHIFPSAQPDNTVAENERRIHDLAGHANDLQFALLRALNDSASALGPRDLKRPDAIAAATSVFERLTAIAMSLNSLDHAFDGASFGEFIVTEYDDSTRSFRLDLADPRLSLIRRLAIRRRLMHSITGLLAPRYVRNMLADVQDDAIHDLICMYAKRANAPIPDAEAIASIRKRSEMLLREVRAEDDFVVLATAGSPRAPMLYHMSMALRWASLAATTVAANLPGKARRAFDEEVLLEDLVRGFAKPEEADAARSAWDDLTVELPARGHFEILRRPFIATGLGTARPVQMADFGSWATVVREILNQGGDVGRRYGWVWEEYLNYELKDTDWRIVGRGIQISKMGKQVTEVDLLLLRDDLLLVAEAKGLTGSGLSNYDHWKSRKVIEKGCRQALLAADHIRSHPEFIASIADRRTAEQVKHVQPVVLTSDPLFDGWSYVGVPVAGNTIRNAITNGSKVERYDGKTHEVVSTEHFIRKDELTTETILKALREPIALKIAPEKGAIVHAPLTVGDLTLLAPIMVSNEEQAAFKKSSSVS